ncbi:hypothetical protein NMG60_11020037 [Bertholletia excelsa]
MAYCCPGTESIVEPFSAVSLNDEFQQAKASVAKAESDVLLKITKKMQDDLGDIQNLFNTLIKLDVINARATYSLSFGGACPDLFLPETKEGGLAFDDSTENKNSIPQHLTERKWTLYLPRAYHPLLLQQHKRNLKKAMKAVSKASAEIRRGKLQGEIMLKKEEADTNLSSLQTQVTKLEQAHPVPVDIFVAQRTRVLVITGPNTGGKTICLKTVGLAALMAKSGLYVLSSEAVKVPWFDCVFADIGDEQSLSQSLSTFSGHLKQISEILKYSTRNSLVLLDEVGAGTNPLEGAALGMSLLESLAESGPLLTMATTHHGELKTLKYRNKAIENACMEFDEEKLRPTYQILWGIPGRSNAINIAERLGLPDVIIDNARELYGATSAEINEVILDMEKLKHNLHAHIREAQNYLKLSRDLLENLQVSRRKVMDHGSAQRNRKMQEISELAAVARSVLHKKVREIRASTIQSSQPAAANDNQNKSVVENQHDAVDNGKFSLTDKAVSSSDDGKQLLSETQVKLPKVGDVVRISSFGKEATVLKVEPSKEEIFVQVGKMRLKLKLADLST